MYFFENTKPTIEDYQTFKALLTRKDIDLSQNKEIFVDLSPANLSQALMKFYRFETSLLEGMSSVANLGIYNPFLDDKIFDRDRVLQSSIELAQTNLRLFCDFLQKGIETIEDEGRQKELFYCLQLFMGEYVQDFSEADCIQYARECGENGSDQFVAYETIFWLQTAFTNYRDLNEVVLNEVIDPHLTSAEIAGIALFDDSLATIVERHKLMYKVLDGKWDEFFRGIEKGLEHRPRKDLIFKFPVKYFKSKYPVKRDSEINREIDLRSDLIDVILTADRVSTSLFTRINRFIKFYKDKEAPYDFYKAQDNYLDFCLENGTEAQLKMMGTMIGSERKSYQDSLKLVEDKTDWLDKYESIT